MNNKDIQRLCKRHMAKCLNYLRMVEADDKIIENVKREFHYLEDDLLSKAKENKNHDKIS